MSGNAQGRQQISDEYIREAEQLVSFWLKKRLDEKGKGTFSSRHELLGILTEERRELTKAVHEGELADVLPELVDIAVACIFGVACIRAGTMDW